MATTVAGATVGAHCDARAATAAGANITAGHRKMRRPIGRRRVASERFRVTLRKSQRPSVEVALADHGELHPCAHPSGCTHQDKIPEKGDMPLALQMRGGPAPCRFARRQFCESWSRSGCGYRRIDDAEIASGIQKSIHPQTAILLVPRLKTLTHMEFRKTLSDHRDGGSNNSAIYRCCSQVVCRARP